MGVEMKTLMLRAWWEGSAPKDIPVNSPTRRPQTKMGTLFTGDETMGEPS